MKYFVAFVACLVGSAVLAEPKPEPQYSGYGHPKGYQAPYGKGHQPAYTSTYPAYSGHYEPAGYDYKPSSYGSYKPPYKADYYCDPRTPPKCATHNATYCLKDPEYPEHDVKYAIDYDPLVLKKYAEVADQSADNLVDGVAAKEETSFDSSHYNGKTFDKSNWVGGADYICPSEVLYARPVRAKNVDGEWRVIVQNVAYYTQTQRVETCLFAGASCRTLAPCYGSKCVQKYVYHRMLSFDPCDSYKGLFIDIYKLPSACSCHIPKIH